MPTSDGKIEVWIESELKKRAVKLAREKGLTLSGAIRGSVRLWVDYDAPDPTAPSRLDLPTTQEIYCVCCTLSLARAVLSGFGRKHGGSLYGWERAQRVSLQAAQVSQAAHLARPTIHALHAQPGAITAGWNRLFDLLDAMDDQNTSEFGARFAEWKKMDARYKRLCDQIDLREFSGDMSQNFAPADEGART